MNKEPVIDSLADAADYILNVLSRFIGANTVFVARNDSVTNTILKVFNRSEVLIEEGAELPLYETYCYLVCQNTDQPVVIRNTEEDPLTSHLKVTRQMGACSFIGVPIMSNDNHSVGTICAMDRKPYIFDQNEISLLKAMAKFLSYTVQLEEALFIDSLTGVYNRNYLKRYMSAMAEGEKGIVMFLDLDDFKHVNDKYGHNTGDMLLQKLADRLKQNMSRHDALIRLGGDEFILLLRADGAIGMDGDIDRFTTDVLSCIRRPFQIGDRSICVTASVGVSRFVGGADWEELIQSADRAMYKVKQSGKDNYLTASN
ncbi:sensor domain-containing diguanylate cyclase [Effusibacillus pohliae]|uniref:sensor domain-containing diguanylate cyclase n=1 Tax=Effusibacillus pohliae TaxID=232270 RepID=UPI00037067E2|nr:sensor domain-containing diguanylate cyclase [Effusibacillus pohliae]